MHVVRDEKSIHKEHPDISHQTLQFSVHLGRPDSMNLVDGQQSENCLKGLTCVRGITGVDLLPTTALRPQDVQDPPAKRRVQLLLTVFCDTSRKHCAHETNQCLAVFTQLHVPGQLRDAVSDDVKVSPRQLVQQPAETLGQGNVRYRHGPWSPPSLSRRTAGDAFGWGKKWRERHWRTGFVRNSR